MFGGSYGFLFRVFRGWGDGRVSRILMGVLMGFYLAPTLGFRPFLKVPKVMSAPSWE